MEDIVLKVLKVVIVAALPVIEVRGSIPLGILVYNLNPILVFTASFIGNIIPAPLILTLLGRIERILVRFNTTKNIYVKYINSVRARSKRYIDRYGFIGLTLFVALPLPSTGVWTGSIVAYIFGVDFWRALKAIILGSLIASTIVTTLTLTANITLKVIV
ncbi:MAG TPA: ligand-binding protein SH3 [Desulfurococcales archaeon]|nr:ligand-binding protein SH3 [Desulfurococcales archaeon]